MTVSLSGLGIPAELVNIIQDNTLQRMFHDALYPRLLFRSEAQPELWPANLGERMLMTRAGLISVDTTPLTPGTDPTPAGYAMEQWVAEAKQWGNSIDTHMPTSYVTMASTFLRNTVTLGLNAAETLNRNVRDSIYNAYAGGETNLSVAALIGATQIQVASINGFTEVLANGRPVPVSAANPIPVTFNGVAAANTVVAASPANPADPLGPGTLFLGAGLSAGLLIRAVVRSEFRARRLRVGGGASVDAIVGTNVLTLQDVINAVAVLRQNKVPPMSDGYYHVHLTPTAEAEIYQDNQFQRLHQSLPDSAAYRDLAIGQLVGCRFYRNTENPGSTNVGTLLATGSSAFAGTSFHGDVINGAGLAIERTIVLGGGCVYEKYLDESKFMTEAGVTGKIGEFTLVNGGVQVMSERIRYILRAPLDRLQQVVGQSWSFSGDYPVPSDQTTGGTARYKRAIIIEHA